MCEAVEAYAREYAAEAEQRALEAEQRAAEAAQKATKAEKQTAAELFKNGVSLEVVLKSLKTLDQETIQKIYQEVMGE